MFPVPVFVPMNFEPEPAEVVTDITLSEVTDIERVDVETLGTEEVILYFADGTVLSKVSLTLSVFYKNYEFLFV